MEFTGKSVQEAIELGLTALGISEENAEITIKKEAVKGLFGKIKENAIVEVKEKKVKETKKEQVKEEKVEVKKEKTTKKAKSENKIDSKEVIAFTEKLLELLDMPAKTEYSEDGENPTINLVGDNSSKLIGFRGEVLDAIQVLVGAKANIGKENYQKVVVDCENYRSRREETLIALANKLEAKATEMKREVILEPMNAFERRIIHTALANSETVTTRSDGVEPNRYVVIVPNDKDEFSKPYNAGRKNDDKFNKRSNHNHNHGFNDKKKGYKNNFSEIKKSSSSFSFGTFLGNFKDDNK